MIKVTRRLAFIESCWVGKVPVNYPHASGKGLCGKKAQNQMLTWMIQIRTKIKQQSNYYPTVNSIDIYKFYYILFIKQSIMFKYILNIFFKIYCVLLQFPFKYCRAIAFVTSIYLGLLLL